MAAAWFNSFGAQVSELTHNIGESATKISESAAKRGQELAEELQQTVTTLASFDLEEIGKVIQDAGNDIVTAETQVKQEDAGLRKTEVKILPWETRIEKNVILSHDLMDKILSLSLEESNFTTAPPAVEPNPCQDTIEEASTGKVDEDSVRFPVDPPQTAEFQLERHIDVAVKMLSLDPNLAKVHARLISHIPEKNFWNHYFSRVAVLRAKVGLEPLCEDLKAEASVTSSSEEYDKVSHGDVQNMNPSTERSPIDADQKLDDADDDDHFSDLGDLDDLDGDSDSSIDATLEAEIAAELGED